VLLDNVDKAAPEVLTGLMEILDTGVMTDGQGNEVNFRSTFIILTTVAGSSGLAKEAVGFGTTKSGRDQRFLVEACRRLFGNEFCNRVDDFVPFVPLGLRGLCREKASPM
jgi:ATP-dependent Clp protease ATP-binding subunit ClpA